MERIEVAPADCNSQANEDLRATKEHLSGIHETLRVECFLNSGQKIVFNIALLALDLIAK